MVLFTLIPELLRKRSTAIEVKKRAIELLTQSNSLEYTRQYLCNLEDSIRQMIASFGGNDILLEILQQLSKSYATPPFGNTVAL